MYVRVGTCEMVVLGYNILYLFLVIQRICDSYYMRDKDATGDGDDSMVEEPTSKLAKCAQNDCKNLHEKPNAWLNTVS